MARPEKRGIDYFPLDVLYYRDEKMQFITALFDLEGEAIVKRIWCRIYEEYGYYMKWNEDIAILFAASLQSRNCGPDKVKQLVEEALKRGLFNKNLFEKYGILTSRRIQQQYLAATRERKRVEFIGDYSLLEQGLLNSNVTVIEVNPSINSVSPTDHAQRKGKQRKENKSTGNTCRYYQNCIGTVNPKIAEEIMMYENLMEPELVCEAISQAARQNAKWAYARAILERCRDNHILTLADFKAGKRGSGSKAKSAEELLRERGYI